MTTIDKHSVMLGRRKTSISLEAEFWTELRGIAADRRIPVSDLVAAIAATPGRSGNLSSAVRIYVLRAVMHAATEVANDPQPVEIAIPVNGGAS